MDCIFCKIVDGSIACNHVYKDDKILAFADLNPQAPTHILIIPKLHIESINYIENSHKDIVAQLFLTAKQIAANLNIAEDGYRLVVNTNLNGGQTVFHLHVHLLAGRHMTWPPG
ncbi:MAG: histidine triad nucleotide-binding protein [Legionellales bacterium RIFCSPHIGHO2_12_FULL_37_14]|nr:MAG: histidine triad nucleotide-binding protein [Legionellales bacterium RIFCSPHIGHO2_12_FULL_37_14]